MSSKILAAKIITKIEMLILKNTKIKIQKSNNLMDKMKCLRIIEMIKIIKHLEKLKKIKNTELLVNKLSQEIFNKKMRIKMRLPKFRKNRQVIEIKSRIFKKIHNLIIKGGQTQNRINKIPILTNTIKNNKTFKQTINFIKMKVKTSSKK